jgi:hypothetical protein
MAQVAPFRAYLALGAGLGLQVLVATTGADWPYAVTGGLGLAAGGLLVFGSAIVAENKGYSVWVGLAGMLSILGVGVVLLLPPYDAFPRPWKGLIPKSVVVRWRAYREASKDPAKDETPR